MSGQRRTWRSTIGAAALAALVGTSVHAAGSAPARSDVVVQALALLGTPYRYGGDNPSSGLDCSGLVRHVFGAVLNLDLPRRSEDISRVGQTIARSELQPGDLVFFNTLQRAFSHVAIYIGEGRFVHAPARNGRVRIEGLNDRYWAVRFNGARRLLEPLPAAAGASAPGARRDSARTLPFWTDGADSRLPEP